jgi:predicted DNA-binding transcriptional regulator YafY
VGITPELVRWIFRWGTGCEVLAPPELRAQVAEMARKVAEVNGGPDCE